MTHPIIKTENYLLVVDNESKIKDGDYSFYWNQILKVQIGVNYSVPEAHKKIIYHLPINNSPILEGVPLLPPLEDDDYVYKLQHTSLCEIDRQFGEDVMYNLDVFIKGYNKAKEKYKYTEEDIDKAYWAGMKFVGEDKGSYKEFIQSLQQPKYPVAFECEMVDKGEEDWIGDDITGEPFWNEKLEPKTITNSQGLTQVIGKYTY